MKYRFIVNGFNRFFSMKRYTIVWMFEIYRVRRFDVVSTMSNFKKWLIQYVNKINRKCSADNERIYYWLYWDNACIYYYCLVLPALLSTLLFCTALIILSLKTKNYRNFWAFASLQCFRLVVPPCLVLPFSSLLLLLVLLILLQSHLVSFLCLLVLPLFHILLSHVSGLLLSFYIVCIFLLPLLSSIPLLWSRFHIWILLIFFRPSTSSSLPSTLVTLLWRFFSNVCYIWIPLSFPPLFCFSLSCFFYNLVCRHPFLLSDITYIRNLKILFACVWSFIAGKRREQFESKTWNLGNSRASFAFV